VALGGELSRRSLLIEDVTSGAVRTRFAPSPTGELHLGGAWTALASWVVARRAGGSTVLRIEDLDSARIAGQAERNIIDDLAWLGFDWDVGPLRQSARAPAYEKAIAVLARQGRVYPCDCSRAEIARAVSAPHAGEESVYPGFCRDRDPSRQMKRPAALRVAVPSETVAFEDPTVGLISQALDRDVGDFVLRRGDGAFAYQLAVVVDDVAMGITDVVRGADLAASTPRQVWLARALGALPPRYAHVPLVVTQNGARLEKRTRGATIRELRAAGVTAERIVGKLSQGLGLSATDAPITPAQVAALWGEAQPSFRRETWTIPSAW
jgi:glutamyl-tRNA synthetase